MFGTKLGVWLLVSYFIRGSSSNPKLEIKLDKIRFLLDKVGFLVRFQKGRFGPRKPILVIDFASCSAGN